MHDWKLDNRRGGLGLPGYICIKCQSVILMGDEQIPQPDWLGWEGLNCDELIACSVLQS